MELTFEEWVEKYKPIKNTFGDVRMFETYGEEYDFVKSQNPANVWTLEDDGEGEYIVSGWHFINRIGYYVTELPLEEGNNCIIDVEDGIEWSEPFSLGEYLASPDPIEFLKSKKHKKE